MNENKDNYELVYENLLKKLAALDLGGVASTLGAIHYNGQLEMKVLGSSYAIGPQGVLGAERREAHVSTKDAEKPS